MNSVGKEKKGIELELLTLLSGFLVRVFGSKLKSRVGCDSVSQYHM